MVGGFVISYLTSESPILFSESACDTYISGPKEDYNFRLQNRAENTALATVCFNVNNAFFNNNGNLVHDYCFQESEISPKSSGLEHTFNPSLILDKSDLKNGDNLTVGISIARNQKIWSLVKRNCKRLNYKCVYRKEYESYRLVN